MFGKNLGKREKILLSVTVGLVAAALSYGIIIDPALTNWKMLNKRIEAKVSELSKDMKLLNMYDRIEAEHLTYSEYINTERTPEEAETSVLAEVENISKKYNCHIANVKPRTSKDIGQYKVVSFLVTAEGTIDQLSQFLFGLETSRELLRVKRFTITPKSKSARELKGAFLVSKIVF